MVLWSRDLAKSRDKLKTSYLLFRKIYDQQTWQVGASWWEEPYGVTWSSENMVICGTWQIKTVTYSLWQDLWSWNLASWWLMMRWIHPWNNMSLQQPGHLKSHDKLKAKYFFLQKTYAHQTLQGADIWWGKTLNEVVWLWSRDHKWSRDELKT